MATTAAVAAEQRDASESNSEVNLNSRKRAAVIDAERQIETWCETHVGTAREIRHACGLQHMKVKDVLALCENLVLQGRIKGRTIDRWRPMGQYSSVKDLLYEGFN